MHSRSLFGTLADFRQAQSASVTRWPLGLRLGLAAGCVALFVGLAWARVESLTAMLPWAVNLGLGVLTGVLGNSLGYWLGALGATPPRACVVSQSLKLAQIVGVPAAYLLLGGHLLALPLLGAALALAGVVWAHRTGRSCTSHPSR